MSWIFVSPSVCCCSSPSLPEPVVDKYKECSAKKKGFDLTGNPDTLRSGLFDPARNIPEIDLRDPLTAIIMTGRHDAGCSMKTVLNARNLPLLIMLCVALYPVLEQVRSQEKPPEVEWADSLLPATARDVLLVTADFSSRPDDVLAPAGLSIVAEIDRSIADMDGLRRYSSLLTAAVIRAEEDEILVVPFIPERLLQSYDPAVVEDLKVGQAEYPEIRPYLSADFQTCVFYLEPGLTASSHALIRQIEDLQSRVRALYGIPLEFSGMRAIRVYNERLLSQDLFKMLPVIFLLVSLIYFLFFRSWRILLAAWCLKVLATAFAYGCFRLCGGQVSPFVILVPIFNFGLLSDYILHMFYHLRRSGCTGIPAKVRLYLTVPLSLTAMTSIIGFASLILLGGEGHVLLAANVGISIVVIYLLVLWWVPSIPGLGAVHFRQKNAAADPSPGAFTVD